MEASLTVVLVTHLQEFHLKIIRDKRKRYQIKKYLEARKRESRNKIYVLFGKIWGKFYLAMTHKMGRFLFLVSLEYYQISVCWGTRHLLHANSCCLGMKVHHQTTNYPTFQILMRSKKREIARKIYSFVNIFNMIICVCRNWNDFKSALMCYTTREADFIQTMEKRVIFIVVLFLFKCLFASIDDAMVKWAE